jgi:branched-chain amino acid transport system substrate-binding protein
MEVKTIMVDPSSMDATSVILEAMSFKPDAIDISMPKEGGIPLFAAAEQQDLGGKVILTGPTSLYDSSVPKAIGPYWNKGGRVFIQLELEPLDKKGGDIENWHAVLNKYGKPSDQRNTFSQAGYLAAAAATDALLKLDPAKVDRASVTEAFRNIKNFKTDVSCSPWYYGPGDEHNAIHAGSVAEIKDGNFVTHKSCFQAVDPDLAGIAKMEKDLHLAD